MTEHKPLTTEDTGRVWVDSRNLTQTEDQAPVRVRVDLAPEQAALLHALVRESGWGYTESGIGQVAADILVLADAIRAARDASHTLETKPPHETLLFDNEDFGGISDRKMITGEDA